MKIKNRKGKEVDFRTDASLTNVIGEKFGSKAASNASSRAYKEYLTENKLTVRDVSKALGYDNIGKVNVRALLENDGTKPLFNTIVEQGLREGWEKSSNWESLITKTVDSDQLSQMWYFLDTDEDPEGFELRDVGQGAPIPVGTIKLGDNSIKMHKRGRGIEWTDEAKRANIDMVSLWLKKLGRNLGREYENTAVQRLLNGYFANGDDAAPTIGVNSAGTWSLGDIFYGAKYMEQELGFSPKRAVMNLNTAFEITNLRNNGAYLYPEELRNGQYADVVNAPPFVSNQVPDNRIILVDTEFALVRYSGKEFGVESERSAKTQVEGSYGTEISEFVPFDKDARLILTLDQAR